jgi:hypothetical protein
MLRILIAICLLLSSCKAIKALKEIHSEKAEVVSFSNNEKTVKFIPMHHIGKPEFYEEVKLLVDSFKKEGFIVFYEGVKPYEKNDSVSLDQYQRKFRKFIGISLDSTKYIEVLHEKNHFKNLVGQPKYADLGISEQDQNVDITKTELIEAYEKKFGEIQLEPGDYSMPLVKTNVLPAPLKLPKKNVQDIIVTYRDQHLAKNIHLSTYNKILVIYGKAHVKGTYSQLKNLQDSWLKTN